jgi:hypothetical protein
MVSAKREGGNAQARQRVCTLIGYCCRCNAHLLGRMLERVCVGIEVRAVQGGERAYG